MDVVTPKRDRAREGLRKLDLVMLAVTINVHDGPFTAFGQNAAPALDGRLSATTLSSGILSVSFITLQIRCLLTLLVVARRNQSASQRAGVPGFLPAEIRRTALTRIQEDRLEDRSSIPQALDFPSTWPPPALCGHPHSSAGAYRIAGIAVAGEDRGAVAVFVLVDELCPVSKSGVRSTERTGPKISSL
jgi:hypothetical protein